MTDIPPEAEWLTRNIRAELARAGLGTATARKMIGMGETAWSARLRDPSRWTIGELLELARITGTPVTELVTHPDAGTRVQVPR